MFGRVQRRDQRSQAHGGDYLVSFVRMNRGGRGLNAREQRAVARRIDTLPALDNPLSALDVSLQARRLPAAPTQSVPAAVPAPAHIPPVGAPVVQPSDQQPAVATGGMVW